MSYPYSVFKTYVAGETLTASDLNSSDVTHPNQSIPEDTDDYSTNLTEMQSMTDPYPGDVASLATALDGEIARLRFQVDAIIGGSQWYVDPDGSLEDIFNNAITLAGAKTLSSVLTITPTSNQLILGVTNTTTLSFTAPSSSLTYTIPDVGGNALFLMSKGDNTVSGVLLSPDGSAIDPARSFTNQSGTGSYLIGTTPGRYGIATDGVLRAAFSDSSLILTIAIAMGSNKITGLAAATATGDAMRFDEACRLTSNQTVAGVKTFSSVPVIPDGTSSLPSPAYAGGATTGLFLSSATKLGFTANATHVLNLTATAFFPETDDAITLGGGANRYADIKTVLINGADYCFANGYILREYPCTEKDIHTKSNKWMKKYANKGIQVINDKGKMVAVIGRDGTFYGKAFKPLSELN